MTMFPKQSRRGRSLLQYDCPWEGHLRGDSGVIVRNSAQPNVVGWQCVKCRCLIYEVLPMSQIVGADGEPLPGA